MVPEGQSLTQPVLIPRDQSCFPPAPTHSVLEGNSEPGWSFLAKGSWQASWRGTPQRGKLCKR